MPSLVSIFLTNYGNGPLKRHQTVILSYSLQNSIQAVSILIAARLGPEELSAASVALMLAFVTGESSNFFPQKSNDPTVHQLS